MATPSAALLASGFVAGRRPVQEGVEFQVIAVAVQ
jgi:hypothetical protein